MNFKDFSIRPQISDPKFGPEPSLRELLLAYYQKSGMEINKAKKCRQQYINYLVLHT